MTVAEYYKTAEERAKGWKWFSGKLHFKDGGYGVLFKWLSTPFEQILPDYCPYCGSACYPCFEVKDDTQFACVACRHCNYNSRVIRSCSRETDAFASVLDAIKMHNELCRKVDKK